MKCYKICSFVGHRKIEITDGLCEAIATEVKRAIDFGCRTFYFLGYGDFDDLCHRIVNDVAKTSERIYRRVRCVLEEKLLQEPENGEDHEEVVFCITSYKTLNKYLYDHYDSMTEESDYMIFYAAEQENSAAYQAFRHAKSKHDVHVVNLW